MTARPPRRAPRRALRRSLIVVGWRRDAYASYRGARLLARPRAVRTPALRWAFAPLLHAQQLSVERRGAHRTRSRSRLASRGRWSRPRSSRAASPASLRKRSWPERPRRLARRFARPIGTARGLQSHRMQFGFLQRAIVCRLDAAYAPTRNKHQRSQILFTYGQARASSAGCAHRRHRAAPRECGVTKLPAPAFDLGKLHANLKADAPLPTRAAPPPPPRFPTANCRRVSLQQQCSGPRLDCEAARQCTKRCGSHEKVSHDRIDRGEAKVPVAQPCARPRRWHSPLRRRQRGRAAPG
jgi:hypothetical protein